MTRFGRVKRIVLTKALNFIECDSDEEQHVYEADESQGGHVS